MRRIATATCIVGALALIGALIDQGAALAQGHNHHRAHHARAHHHVKKARRSHLRRLAPVAPAGATGATGATGASGATGTTGEPSVGKVEKFENGVLTLALNNGTTISGNVTSETRIKCESPAGTAKMADFGGQGGREDGSDDDDQENGTQESCGLSALKPGVTVGEALVNIAPAGNTFIEIELLVQPTTTTEKSNFGDDEFGREGGFGGGDHQDD